MKRKDLQATIGPYWESQTKVVRSVVLAGAFFVRREDFCLFQWWLCVLSGQSLNTEFTEVLRALRVKT